MAPPTQSPNNEANSPELPEVAEIMHEWPMPEPRLGADGFTLPPKGAIPVVGIGGSAGSLAALQAFFSALPTPTHAAYVVVVHLLPEQDSGLASIIQRSTSLPVMQVVDAVKVQADHIYVIPPGKIFAMNEGVLHSIEHVREKGRHVTVDLFFRTLAETHGPQSTAIVLSGGDGDGALGIKRIKERGGLTIAQDPEEAEHDSMPRASIATEMVDWVLPAGEMPRRLAEYWENGRNIHLADEANNYEEPPGETAREAEDAALKTILAYLKARTGHDFAYYKRATIYRRISRRMQVNACSRLTEYLTYLRTHPGEAGALLQDLLISVTNFFRDHGAFHSLEEVIPEMFQGKGPSDQLRVWVPACATGEEAYSIAILLAEHASKMPNPPQIQIFATDLDQSAIDVAREGSYPASIVEDVTEERLRRFFSDENGCYTVKRELREMVLFALHDLLRDSPFSRVDLVSCRNLLIYLNREAQSKVYDIFHFALHPGGTMFLGSSDSAEEATGLFDQIDKKNRLYRRRKVQMAGLTIPSGGAILPPSVHGRGRTSAGLATRARGIVDEQIQTPSPARSSVWSELHLKLIEHVSPPSVVVNLDYDIVHVSKTAGTYLRVAGGQPTINLLNLIHPQLKTELRAALFRASKSNAAVRVPGIPIDIEGHRKLVSITVNPVEDLTTDFLLVVLDPKEIPDGSDSSGVNGTGHHDPGLVGHLEEELDQLRATLRSTVEQYEASTEELKASNEELQAMNEELHSATEELETGREELQSINEEIITINQELKSKVSELSCANADLHNLMTSTKIATIFLDRELRINRFTPSTAGLFNFIPSDLGRPLFHLTHQLDYPTIADDAYEVIERLSTLEREVRNADGRWFLVRQSPYRTAADQIAGVVITFIDITERKKIEGARAWLSSIVESSHDAIISFGLDGVVLTWNHGAEQIFGYQSDEIVGRTHALLAPPELQGEKQELLKKLQKGEAIASFETVRLRKDGQRIDVSLTASLMTNEMGEVVAATAIFRDITARKKVMEELKAARTELEARVEQRTAELRQRVEQLAQMAAVVTLTEQRERRRMSHILHDELQQLLVSAKLRIDALPMLDEQDRNLEHDEISNLLDEIISNSRSLATDLSPTVLGEGLGPALQWLSKTWMMEKYKLKVNADIDLTIDTPRDELRSLIFFAAKELLFNVVKHSGIDNAELRLAALDTKSLILTVRDHGSGFAPVTPEQGSSASGLGLSGLSERLEMLGASLVTHSKPQEGVEATLIAPLLSRDPVCNTSHLEE